MHPLRVVANPEEGDKKGCDSEAHVGNAGGLGKEREAQALDNHVDFIAFGSIFIVASQ